VDAQVSYAFPEGRFHGLTLLLQAYNLTDSPYRSTSNLFPGGQTERPETYETYGKKILFGFNWKM
jgi:outer membrane receptor protein involved in Fe transport